MKKHVNIPIFIPHLGCPNQCVFCNQRTISGVEEFDADSVVSIIDKALSTVEGAEAEIAFFGGSFTGIDIDLMIHLLEIAYGYVKSGRVTSIRCSTRPDYINEEILDILERYSVKTIELGLQSSSDSVLLLSKRGHSFSAEENAVRLITERGFELVGQMMIGLPGATSEDEIDTARFIIASGASGARIYPTVVFHDTELCEMTKAGVYTPITLEESVNRSANVLKLFLDAGVDVIRIGLCSSDNLLNEKTYFAGPNHPSLGELVESRVYLDIISGEADKLCSFDKKTMIVYVAKGCLSKAIGNRRINKNNLISRYGLSSIKFVEDSSLSDFDVRLELY